MVVQCSLLSLVMLKRTEKLGSSIMMLTYMLSEVARFFSTFGLMMMIFLMLNSMLNSDFTDVEEQDYWGNFLNLYKSLNGKSVLQHFTTLPGQVFITTYIYIF